MLGKISHDNVRVVMFPVEESYRPIPCYWNHQCKSVDLLLKCIISRLSFSLLSLAQSVRVKLVSHLGEINKYKSNSQQYGQHVNSWCIDVGYVVGYCATGHREARLLLCD